MIKAILLLALVFSFYSTTISQSIKHFGISDVLPSNTFTYSRLKYDNQGNLYILFCDGKQFFIITNKDGEFTTPKPVALKVYDHPLFWNNSSVDGYDFEIDNNGVIHIAFYILHSNNMHMFYTNSLRDSAVYLGAKPHSNSLDIKINSLISISKSGIDDITINFISSPINGSYGWLRVINPHKHNRIVQDHNFFDVMPVSYAALGKTKMYLFSFNIYYIDQSPSTPPDSVMLVKRSRYIYSDGTLSSMDTTVTILVSPFPDFLHIPYNQFDQNENLVTLDYAILKNDGNPYRFHYIPRFVFTYDNLNSVHKVENNGYGYNDNFGYPPYIYKSNNLNIQLSLDPSLFIDTLGFANISLAAFSPTKAAALIHTSNLEGSLYKSIDYLFLFENGSLKTYLIPSPRYFEPYFYKGKSFVLKNDELYIIQSYRRTRWLDTLAPWYLFRISEINNDYRILYDTSKIKRIRVNTENFKTPLFETKDGQLNYFQLASNNLFYYKQQDENNWIKIRINRQTDTVVAYSFSRDGNKVLHIAYLNRNGKVFYTNDLSGSFINPVEIPNISGEPYDIKISATKNGNLYIFLFYYNDCKFIFGNISNFSLPKSVAISSSSEIAVDQNGYLYALDDRNGNGTPFLTKILMNNVIYSSFAWNLPTLTDLKLIKDSVWNVHLVGFEYFAPQRLIYSNSNLDFNSYEAFNLGQYYYYSTYFTGEPFFDDRTKTIYFLFYSSDPFTAADAFHLGKLPIETTGSIDKTEIIPQKFYLYQNFPNPFNSKTIISFDLPQREFVTLDIYNVLGRRIKSLINEEKDAGKHKVELDLNGFSSGVYFYSIQAGNFKETKKMILSK